MYLANQTNHLWDCYQSVHLLYHQAGSMCFPVFSNFTGDSWLYVIYKVDHINLHVYSSKMKPVH